MKITSLAASLTLGLASFAQPAIAADPWARTLRGAAGHPITAGEVAGRWSKGMNERRHEDAERAL